MPIRAGVIEIPGPFTIEDSLPFPDAVYPLRIQFPSAGAVPVDQRTAAAEPDTEAARPIAPPGEATPLLDDTGATALATARPGQGSGSQFAEAFRDLNRPSQGVGQPGSDAPQLLSLSFSIENRKSGSTSIEVRKAVKADGVPIGKVGLRIVNDTTILVDRHELVSLFGDRLGSKPATSLASPSDDDAYVDFKTLRAAGIDVRYDAVHDVLLMSTRTS